MVRNVLVVEDDPNLLLSARQALEGHQGRLTLLRAGDGRVAREHLRRQPISLVAVDLATPHLDGVGLLSHAAEHYPDVPVIALTDLAAPQAERTAQRLGAVACLQKPVRGDALEREILRALDRQSEGGTLQRVSGGIFVQMLRLEQRTCTIRLAAGDGGPQGVLFVVDGEVVDARTGSLRGEPAAHEIFRWREVNLTIQNTCALRHRPRIASSLDALLLEAVRRRDEEDLAPEAEPAPAAAPGADPVSRVRRGIEQALGASSGVLDVYADPAARDAMAALRELGERLGLGEALAARLPQAGPTDKVVLPTVPPTVVEVSRNVPGARLLEIITGL